MNINIDENWWVKCSTIEEYNQLMVECESNGIEWFGDVDTLPTSFKLCECRLPVIIIYNKNVKRIGLMKELDSMRIIKGGTIETFFWRMIK